MQNIIKKREVLIVAFILLIAVVGVCFAQQKKSPTTAQGAEYTAVLNYGDDETLEIDLTVPAKIKLPTNENVVIQVRDDHSVGFIHSDCLDQICVNTGFLSASGELAACLPNSALLLIEDMNNAHSGADIVV